MTTQAVGPKFLESEEGKDTFALVRTVIGWNDPYTVRQACIAMEEMDLTSLVPQVTVPLLRRQASTDIFLAAGISGGYAWLFPKGERANLGAGVAPPHKSRLPKIVAELHARLVRDARVGKETLGLTGGSIPVGGMLRATGNLGYASAAEAAISDAAITRRRITRRGCALCGARLTARCDPAPPARP